MANSSQKNNTVNSTTQIFEILTATIESLNDMNDLIVKNNISEKTINKIKTIVQGGVDILKIIIDNSKTFTSLNKVILNDKNIKKLLSAIKYIFIELKNLSKVLGKSPIASKTIIKSLLGLQEILIQLIEIQNIVIKMKIAKSTIAFLLLPIFLLNLSLLSISLIVLGITFLALLPMGPIIQLGLFLLSEVFNILGGIFNTIANIKYIKALIVLKMLRYLINDMIYVLIHISNLSKIMVGIDRINIIKCLAIWGLLAEIFIRIGEIKIMWMKSTLKKINLCINLMSIILKKLNRIRIRKNTLKNIFQLNVIFVLLNSLFNTIILTLIPSILFVLSFPIIFLAVLCLLPLAKLINLISKSVKMKSVIGIINLTIISILLLGVMTVLALIALIASTIDITNVLKAMLILGIYTAFMVLLKFVSKFLDASIIGVLLMLAISALVFTIIIGSIFLMSIIAATIDITNVLKAMLILGIYIGFIVLLNLFKSQIIVGVIVLILLSVSIIFLSISLLLLNKSVEGITLENIGIFSAIMGVIIGFAVTLSFMPFILIGIGVITALGVSLILFATGLKILMSAGFTEKDSEKAIAPIKAFETIADYLSNSDADFSKASRKAKKLASISKQIGKMAKVLQDIASLNIPIKFDNKGNGIEFVKMTGKDFIEAATNAASIASILSGMFGEEDINVVVGGENVKIKPISESALERITFSAMIKMKMLNQIVESVGDMAKVLSNLAALVVPDETKGFDENGKPKGWRTMKKTDFTLACENIATIMVTLLSGMTEYRAQSLGGRTVMDAIDDMSRSAIKKLGMVLNAFGNMESLVNVIQQMANMSVPTAFDKDGKPISFKPITAEERQKAIENAVLLMTEFLKAITDPALSEQLEEMDSDAAENFERVMNGATGISALIDSLGKALEFDKTKVATGIGNIRSAIVQYSKMVSDLFYEKWGLVWKTKKIMGIPIPYPTWTIVDKAEIDIHKMEDAIDGMEQVGKTIDPMKKLIDSINAVVSGENAGKMKDGVNILAKIIKTYTESITGNEKGKGGIIISEAGTKRITRFVLLINTTDKFSKINTDNLQKNTDTFIRFIDKANSVDVNKIKSIRDMFEQMAEFSKSVKGDFDKLADILSEKLVDILDKLNTTISDVVNSDVNTNTSNNHIFNKLDNSISGTEKEQKEQKEKNQQKQDLKGISDSIEDMLEVLKQIKDNTENKSFYQ